MTETKIRTSTGREVKHDEGKILLRKPSKQWIETVYSVNILSDNELDLYYDMFRYKGFNRDIMLAQMEELLKDPKLTVQAIIACSMQGPTRASQIKLSNGQTLSQMGIPASGQQGTERLSCQRISAATADLAAFYLKKFDFPKRIIDNPLPGWLQFPTAGSIKLPSNLREQHIEFLKRFTPLIGGSFRDDIYGQMIANAYLDPKLKLFG